MGRRPRRRSQHFAPVATVPTASTHHISDWANLPDDLLRLIARATKNSRDMHCIRGACDSWRDSPMLEDYDADPSTQLPWLIVTEDPESDDDNHRRCFFDITCFRSLPFPTSSLRHIHGSSRGWLVVDGGGSSSNADLQLVNPLTAEAIPLPPLAPPTTKFVLSGGPRDEERQHPCILMAIHGVRRELAYTRPGHDQEWHALPGDDDSTTLRPLMCFFTDVVYHEASFLAVNGDGVVIGVELGDDATATFRRIGKEKVGEEMNEERQKRRRRRRRWPYLASVGEDLCVVMRYMKKVAAGGGYRTIDFDVYFYDPGVEEWEHFPGCLDYTLFVGLGESLAIPAAATGWTPNCIYFSDVDRPPRAGEGDMGMYYFQDGYLEPHFVRHGAFGIWHLPTFT